MALSDIEKYINKNKSDVDDWLTILFGEYVRCMMIGDDAQVPSYKVTSDARRVGKFIEVVRHYGIGKVVYQKGVRPWYDIYIDHGVFERLAPQYAKAEAFKIRSSDKSTDRVDGYPPIGSISGACMLHIYFNPDLYTIYDRMETIDNGYRRSNINAKEKRIIRVYPKDLEGDAERNVFLKTLLSYYNLNVDRAIELLYGYKTKVLSNLPAINPLQDPTLKNMGVHRINNIPLNELCVSRIKRMLPVALVLQEYANGLVEDLTALVDVVGETNEDIVDELITKAPGDLMIKAPFMMASTSKLEQTIATMLLKGSNRGLI